MYLASHAVRLFASVLLVSAAGWKLSRNPRCRVVVAAGDVICLDHSTLAVERGIHSPALQLLVSMRQHRRSQREISELCCPLRQSTHPVGWSVQNAWSAPALLSWQSEFPRHAIGDMINRTSI